MKSILNDLRRSLLDPSGDERIGSSGWLAVALIIRMMPCIRRAALKAPNSSYPPGWFTKIALAPHMTGRSTSDLRVVGSENPVRMENS